MIIKKATYRKCPQCGIVRRIADEEYGCDGCGAPLNYTDSNCEFLRMTVFSQGAEGADVYHFCSWQCVLKKLATLSCDYFIDMPFLHFDTKNKKIHADNFWQAIADWAKK